MDIILEVIAFSIGSCEIIERSGGQRIELCDNPGEGGTTPSYGMIAGAREKTSIDLYPIIRPRGGDFLYTADEFEVMKADVRICRQLGCDGVVTGILNADGSVDTARTAQLVELAYPMEVTFHRAFDRASDPLAAMEDIISTGCERILTSGQKPTAMEGAGLIAELISKAASRIIIMPGSGVRADNIELLAKQTGANEFHTSARTTSGSLMLFNQQSMKEQLQEVIVDEAALLAIKKNIVKLSR